MGSIGLGAFIGFLITVALGIIFPGAGHILGAFLGGIVAGLIARGIIGGTIAGILSGVFSAIILVILAFFGFALHAEANLGFIGALVSGIAGAALSIIVGVVGAVASAIGGFIGGLMSR